MTNVAQADQDRTLPDFPYTPEQLRQIAEAARNEGYPPASRDGVGPVTRRRAA